MSWIGVVYGIDALDESSSKMPTNNSKELIITISLIIFLLIVFIIWSCRNLPNFIKLDNPNNDIPHNIDIPK